MTLAMQGGPTPEFFGEVAVLVVVGALIAYACHRIGLLPIVGFLVTGVVIVVLGAWVIFASTRGKSFSSTPPKEPEDTTK